MELAGASDIGGKVAKGSGEPARKRVSFKSADDFSCFETRSAPRSLAATLAALPPISEVLSLDSWVPDSTLDAARRR